MAWWSYAPHWVPFWLNICRFHCTYSLVKTTFGSHYSCKSSRICLYQSCTSGLRSFCPFFLGNCSSCFRLNGECWWKAIYKTCYRLSIEMRKNKIKHWNWNHSQLKLLQCKFGSMLRVVILLEGKPPTYSISWNRFSSWIAQYLAPFFLPSCLLSSMLMKSIHPTWCYHHHAFPDLFLGFDLISHWSSWCFWCMMHSYVLCQTQEFSRNRCTYIEIMWHFNYTHVGSIHLIIQYLMATGSNKTNLGLSQQHGRILM